MITGGMTRQEIIKEFSVKESEVPLARDILYARYDIDGYEGTVVVLFRRDGKLFEVHGGHCSCYGLEGQWEPEETTVEGLLKTTSSEYGGGLREVVLKLAGPHGVRH